jgi:ABC-type sugar transport system ATPase subunit
MWDGSLARLELCGLTKRFPAAAEPAVQALDLSMEAGEFLAVVGPSGSGKSTLLRLIAGLETPTEGAVWIDSRSMLGVAPSRRGVSLVFQQPALYPHLDVFENIAFGLRARRVRRTELRRRVSDVADLLGIETLLTRDSSSLSGGEQQRVALARALAVEPSILLLDEPFAGLDVPLRESLRPLLLEIHRRLGMTTVLVTHDQAEAMALGDRVAVMASGRLLQCDTPRQVYDQPTCRFVAEFLGSPPMNVLPLEIERAPGSFRLRLSDLVVQVPSDISWAAPLHGLHGGRVQLGVRPEHVSLAADRPASASFLPLTGRTLRQEMRGHETLATLDCQGTTVNLRIAPDRAIESGREVAVRLDLARAAWFDPASGTRLRPPGPPDQDSGRDGSRPLPFQRQSPALVG